MGSEEFKQEEVMATQLASGEAATGPDTSLSPKPKDDLVGDLVETHCLSWNRTGASSGSRHTYFPLRGQKPGTCPVRSSKFCSGSSRRKAACQDRPGCAPVQGPKRGAEKAHLACSPVQNSQACVGVTPSEVSVQPTRTVRQWGHASPCPKCSASQRRILILGSRKLEAFSSSILPFTSGSI